MKLAKPLMWIATLLFVAIDAFPIAADEIEITQLERTDAVDFQREVLPVFQRSCLACHNESTAESDLVLESPASILLGGATGEVVIPGEPDKSFLLQVSAHREEPVMPPEDNSVEAPNLTPDELGLIRLWILQGAKASAESGEAVEFEPLPNGLNPVYAIALSDDSQILAAGRANQVSIYHLPSQRELARLTDPLLLESGIYSRPGVAHLDLVQSIAISPDRRRIATGGFRTVKLWEQQSIQVLAKASYPQSIVASASLDDMSAIAFGNEAGQIYLVDAGTGAPIQFWAAHQGPISAIAALPGGGLISCGEDGHIRHWRFATDAQLPSLLRGGDLDVGQSILAFCLLKDQSHFVIATGDQQLQLWSISSVVPSETAEQPAGQQMAVRSWDSQAPSTRLIRVVNSAESQIVTGAGDGKLRLWNHTDGSLLRTFEQGGAVTDVIALEGGTQLASCGLNQSIKVWDVAGGKELHNLQGDPQQARDLAAADLEQRLRQRLLELAKADFEAGNQRKTAEEENLNKSKEALTAGEADLQTKTAAVAETQKAFAAAEEKVTQAKAQVATDAKTIEMAKGRLAEFTPQRDAAGVKLQQIMQTLAKSDQDLQKSLAELAQQRELVANNPKALEQLKALQNALSKVSELTAQQVMLVEGRQTADEAYQSLVAAVSGEEAKVKQTEETLKATQAALPAAEKLMTDTKAAADKAKQDAETSQRNLESLQRAVVRAEEAVQVATEAVPGLQTKVTAAEQALQVAQQQLADATAAQAATSQAFAALAYQPDRGTLCSLTTTGRLQTWDLATGAPLETLEELLGASPSESAVQNQLVILADHRLAVVGATQLSLVDLGGEWKLTRQIGAPDGESPFVDRVTALDFDPSGELLAVGGGEPSRTGQILLIDSRTGEVVRELQDPHSDTVWAVQFSPDGTRLASGGADRFMKVFEVETGELVRGFEGHTHHVLGVAWSADGRRLASAGADKSVKIWDAITGEQQRTIEGFGKEATAVRFVGLENQVVVSSGDQTVQVKRADNGGNVRGFGGFSDFVHCVDSSADGQTIVAGGQDSVVRVWSLDGKLLAEFQGQTDVVAADDSTRDTPTSAAVSKD